MSAIKRNDLNMWIFYDDNGPVTIKYGTGTFHYVTNLQGDVVAIVGKDGQTAVEYTYDAWGKVTSITGIYAYNLGIHNPILYRGYVYDHETGFYYCQSRYYDPEIGRWLNADALISTGQGMLGNNMFVYCLNNPVSCADFSGQSAMAICKSDTLHGYHLFGGGGGCGIGGVLLAAAFAASFSNTAEYTTMNVARTDAFIAEKRAKAKEEAQAITITATTPKKHQEFFPPNPLMFHPAGLVMKIHVDFGKGSNGAVIKWEIPGTKIAIFEWNEDFDKGPHYHVMLEEWKNQHLDPEHYKAGDPVPEPWNTLYFGGL